ncbi:MAG: transcriptional repressor LexA [Patescibacteria group bacterium]|jgi:repressor LexA|nr:transcriptional repressor LexA [Patescibacteria group bacterium]MDP6756217.1 transcriptional repressor LexA [Patescibacteria group bacterium]|tara:strand:- start:18777 stop:19409 length:633 start_codon:yes stop_codon:yes gene_type:complete
MTIILPKKKQQILDFLKHYIKDRGYAPTLSEIAKKFKVSSLATIHEHLKFLEDNKFIKRIGNIQSRELEILDQSNSNVDEAYIQGSMSPVPLVGLITAGEPIEAIETREQDIAIPAEITRGKQCYILKVKGDSMVESLITDGDLVIVEKTEYAKNGDMVVAVLDDGTATLKKFYKEKNYVRLQPANKKYKPIMAPNVLIRGRVVGIIRKY